MNLVFGQKQTKIKIDLEQVDRKFWKSQANNLKFVFNNNLSYCIMFQFNHICRLLTVIIHTSIFKEILYVIW